MNQALGRKPKVRLGPNGKPVRYFVMPQDWRGRLRVWRFSIARRVVQIGVLLLFMGTFRWGWSLFGQPLLSGDLSASRVVDLIPLADPFAALQILLAGHWLQTDALIGAGIVLLIYGILSGRTWCAWVCPMNLVTDAANSLRSRLGFKDLLHLRRGLRYVVLAMSLILSALTGVAAFEWVSPIAVLHRELIFGVGLGWIAVLGVFLFDLLVVREGWCGHLCPLGAFFSLVGKVGLLRVRFDTPTCTHCAECVRVCPEPQVMNLNRAAKAGLVSDSECTNCGRCVAVCPEDTLHFDWRPLMNQHRRTEPTNRSTS